jgi:hypothetical protein
VLKLGGGGGSGTNYWGPAFLKWARGSTVMQMFFSFSVVSLFVDATPFRRSASHSAIESQYFRFSVKIFSPSTEKKKFTGTEARCRRHCTGLCPVAGYCEHVNERSAPVSHGAFLE